MSQHTDNNYYGGGGSGGGFLTGGSPYAGGSPGGFGRRNEVSHSLRPMTIHQLQDASQAHSDADWMLDETEIGQVTVVGQVVSIQSQATNSLYWLDDGTGRIEARHWTDSSLTESSEKWDGVLEGTYVRVLGNLKMFGNKRYINATHIRNVQSPDEIYFHLLEAMTVTLTWERGPPPGPGQTHRLGAVANAPGAAAAVYKQSHSTASNEQYAHLPALQQSIISFILSQPTSTEGVHVGAIARAVGGDAITISDALDKLMDEGHVFSTINDSHFNVAN
ncbi:hypothetical protein SERLA73DRAFT_189801 [Serpula lacrymans var. lacrymans S7.3]|uniref:Replication protein A C-terminal domain-containing protein n=2 Tax=Serpula lacrymans var. lacrymans TaxID=341189 RepID=F8QEK5_SERL3|nr:uncharacterized protein SERLADRAFT_480906 [Serpula lacrymans var. lacrymans S7.9]EGN93261.1 hypothetical protein SERLA73DRAFT_189801 [Serpula lacrymans var. lacrymans S7.3]EGO18644.1 hypothetical protein SERLADRAFT_480906 [Serpula lacrymans var. lacrymans S7.9]